MKSGFKENICAFDVLHCMKRGYVDGDFGDFFELLAKNCVVTAGGTEAVEDGYDEVVKRFKKIGESVKECGITPGPRIIELTGEEMIRETPSNYFPGRLGLLIEETIDSRTDLFLFLVDINEKGEVVNIISDLPRKYKYRDFDSAYIELTPTYDAWSEYCAPYRYEGRIGISEPYFGGLYTFFARAGKWFDHNKDMTVSYDAMEKALKYWAEFCDSDNIQEAFEKTAGIDFENSTIEYPEVAEYLQQYGKDLWENRELNRHLVDKLIEWVEEYKNPEEYITINGCPTVSLFESV